MNKATEKTTAKRCAIYTRKSTDEGLDKDYNSLEAQFDACAAYIHSQSGKGWTIVDKHYDDGGYSGISPEPKASREAGVQLWRTLSGLCFLSGGSSRLSARNIRLRLAARRRTSIYSSISSSFIGIS